MGVLLCLRTARSGDSPTEISKRFRGSRLIGPLGLDSLVLVHLALSLAPRGGAGGMKDK